MAYITNYNFKRIYRLVAESNMFKDKAINGVIYPDIRFDFFNNLEEKDLLAFKAFVDDPEFYINEYFEHYISKDNSEFLEIEDKKPAYHSEKDCKRLLSDFKRLLVPEVIKARGQEEIERFREFYQEHKQLFLENPEAFEMRASLVFGVTIKIESLTLPNSGAYEIDNYRIDDVKSQILEKWNQMKKWLNEGADSAKKRTLYRYFCQKTFLATAKNYKDKPIKFNKTEFSDKEIKDFLNELYSKYKQPIINLLKVYYKVAVNPNLEIKGDLLERLGFCPCVNCNETIFRKIILHRCAC